MRSSRAAAGQLVPGGRPEVVFGIGDGTGPLRWYQWDGGAWVGHDLLGTDIVHGHSLALGDVDEDGNLDIFAAEMGDPGHGADATAWIFYGDGQGHFRKEVVSTGLGQPRIAARRSRRRRRSRHPGQALPSGCAADRRLAEPATPALDRWQRHVIDADEALAERVRDRGRPRRRRPPGHRDRRLVVSEPGQRRRPLAAADDRRAARTTWRRSPTSTATATSTSSAPRARARIRNAKLRLGRERRPWRVHRSTTTSMPAMAISCKASRSRASRARPPDRASRSPGTRPGAASRC